MLEASFVDRVTGQIAHRCRGFRPAAPSYDGPGGHVGPGPIKAVNRTECMTTLGHQLSRDSMMLDHVRSFKIICAARVCVPQFLMLGASFMLGLWFAAMPLRKSHIVKAEPKRKLKADEAGR